MSKPDHTLRITPIRSIQEFVGGNQWNKPTLNPNEFGELQKQVISNLIYYQSNYGIITIPILLLIAFFRPAAMIFGLVVVAALVFGFVYASKQNIALPPFLHDRPLVILLLILVAAFMVVRMFGTVFIFLFGIALPLALTIVHATIRVPTIQNKAENTAENLSLQATPMGLFLSWLGTKVAEQQTTPTPKRK